MYTGLFNRRNELLLNLEKKESFGRWEENGKNRKSDLKKEFEELKNRVNNVGNERRRSEIKMNVEKEEDKGEDRMKRNTSRMKVENMEKKERRSLNLIVSEQSSTIPTPASSYRKSQSNFLIDTMFAFKKSQDNLQKLVFSKLTYLSTRIAHLQKLLPQLYIPSPPSTYSLKHFQLTISQLQLSNKSLLSLNSSLKSQLQSHHSKYQSQRSYYLDQLQSLRQKSITKSQQSQINYQKMVINFTNQIQQLKLLLQQNNDHYQQLEHRDKKILQQQQKQIQKLVTQNRLKQQQIKRIEIEVNSLKQEKQMFANEVQKNKVLLGSDRIYEQKNAYVVVLEYLKRNIQKQKHSKQKRQKFKQTTGIYLQHDQQYQMIQQLHNIIKQLNTQILSKDTSLLTHKHQSQSLQLTLSNLQNTFIPSLQSQLLLITSQNKQLINTIKSLQFTNSHLQQTKLTLQNQIQSSMKQTLQKDTKIFTISLEFQQFKQSSNLQYNVLLKNNIQLQQKMKQLVLMLDQNKQQLNKLNEQNQKIKQRQVQVLKQSEINKLLSSEVSIKIQECKGLSQKIVILNKKELIFVSQIQELNNRLQKRQQNKKQDTKKQQYGKDNKQIGNGDRDDVWRQNVDKEFGVIGDYNNSENFDIGEVEVKRVEEREITDFFLRLKYGIERMVEGEEVEVDVPKEIKKQYGDLMELIERRVGKELSVIELGEESKQIGNSIMEDYFGIDREVEELTRRVEEQEKIIEELNQNKKDQKQHTINQTRSQLETIKQQ